MPPPTSTLAARPADPPSFRERTLAQLVDHVRALIPVGAVTFVTLDEQQGRLERSAGWFADPDLRDALGGPGTVLLNGGRRTLLEAALERERPLFLPRVDAWEAAPELYDHAVASLGPERAERAWQRYRGASVIACPLRTEIGKVLGLVLVASLEPGRPLGRADLSAVEVVADLAAMALERASLLEEEARRGRVELRLKRAAEAVSGSLELDEVYRRVVEHAADLTGATTALLTRLNRRSGKLRTVASVELSATPGGPPLRLERTEFSDVARTRRPVLRADGSLMHTPIELGPRLYGVLTVSHEERGRFGEQHLDLLARMARSSAAAIANAIDFRRERRIARALTLGFVPESLPEVAGYETGLLYAPALGEPTGGDVYGAWQLPGGEIAVLVGDVAGKGVENAALSAMVRFFVEARSWDESSPAAVLAQANSMLMGRLPSDTFVTAFYGVLSPIAPGRAEPAPSRTASPGTLRWAGAGHLPPLHVSGSAVRSLDSQGLPLGIDAEPGYAESELELAVGDLVFAFSDGLVEARRAGMIYGVPRLSRLVRRLAQTLGPEELVRSVHDEVSNWAGALGDDAVALALRRRR